MSLSLASFRRHVASRLIASRGARLDAREAARTVERWDRLVTRGHRQGCSSHEVATLILDHEKTAQRDPSRWRRLIAWRDRKMAEKREDFADMTHNVGEVTKAVARGQLPKLDDLRAVRTPIGGYRMGDDTRRKPRRRRR